MSKTFDYARAWDEVARPVYEALSPAVLALVEQAAVAGRECSQLADCSLAWPEGDAGEALKAAFRAVSAEDLSFAARAVYFFGHWQHKRSTVRPEWLQWGGGWRFAHYADQDLRERFGMPSRGDNGRAKGFHLQIIEGAVRLCYASDDMWTWDEVAPATEPGMVHARALQSEGSQALGTLTNTRRERKRDNAAYYAFMEGVKSRGFWPATWQGFADTAAYMVEEDTIKAREAERPDERQKRVAKLIEQRDKKIRNTTINATAECARMVWLAERGVDLDNVIYYTHTDIVCFGWLRPVSHEQTSVLVDLLCEYPYAYEIKSESRGVISTRERSA